MSWACDMPPELLARPMGLVILTGLDLVYNAIHKAIWDSFYNNRRSDRVPLKFLSLEADHEYVKCRQKRPSYEWYIPKGILKSCWMTKHLDTIPAVVVLFFDFDWDDPMWKERQMECSTRVEIVRNSLSGRGTRICVVLVQKNAPLPPGEDAVASERAASLCSSCDLSAKSLFVLPLTDHLLGYTIRLENAFYELSQSYYHAEARRVKSHRDFLNKTTHQLLFVRHQFKIAFFNELKQDPHTAVKHYKQAYIHLLELRLVDNNLLEAKTIAGFVNYKICRLLFQLNTPLDAIAQFRRHVDFFKTKIGIAELSFEHFAWMAKQFQLFGDLFEEAVKLGGLTAIQTQHPGFYYQQAAGHSATRRQLAAQLSPSLPALSDVLDKLNSLDYIGQRPWRQGHQGVEVPDAAKEKDGILSLQLLESKVDHSGVIIPLLGSAIAQFKKYKSLRMKRYLMVQMGEEYYHANDYNKALTLLSRVTWEYRQERWSSLLTSVLATQLKCAYLLRNVQEYITVCLELIGKYTDNHVDDKERIHRNLMQLAANAAPEPELWIQNESAMPTAAQLWSCVPAGVSDPSLPPQTDFTIEMMNIAPFVECKAAFMNDSFPSDVPVTLKVFLRSSSPLAVTFNKLFVTFNNQAYNKHCILNADSTDAHGTDLSLLPNETKVYSFRFVSQLEDIGKTLEITSVCLELGSAPTFCVRLYWAGAGGDAVPPLLSQGYSYQRSSRLQRSQQVMNYEEFPVWEDIVICSVTRLQARDSSAVDIDVQHSLPGFVNEAYHYTVTVTNNEPTDITNVRVMLALKDVKQSSHTRIHMDVMDDSHGESSQVWSVSSVKSGQQVMQDVYSVTTAAADLILIVTVSFEISVDVEGSTIQCSCCSERNVCLSVVEPFTVGFELYNCQFEKIEAVNDGESFVLLTDVHSLTSCPLKILSSHLLLSPHTSSNSDDAACQSQLSSVTLKSAADHVGECFCLSTSSAAVTASQTSASPQVPVTSSQTSASPQVPVTSSQTSASPQVPLGQYSITVQRDDSSSRSFDVVVELPAVDIVKLPVYIQLDIPSVISVQSSATVVYTIHNRSDSLQDFDIVVESSDAFMFAGQRQVHFRILPHDSYRLMYNMVPLTSGNVQLPKLHLNMPRHPELVTTAVHRMLPNTVFVLPRHRDAGVQ